MRDGTMYATSRHCDRGALLVTSASRCLTPRGLLLHTISPHMQRSPFNSSLHPEMRDEAREESITHHQSAIYNYDISISSMRAAIASNQLSLRMMLLTCVMIVSFESLHANIEASKAQFQSGIALFAISTATLPSVMEEVERGRRMEVDADGDVDVDGEEEEIEEWIKQIFGRREFDVLKLADLANTQSLEHRSISEMDLHV